MFLKYNVFTIIWCITVLFLTLATGETKSNLAFNYTDKLVHIAMFTPLSLLMIVGFRKQVQFFKIHCYPVKYALIISIAFGIVIELIQWILPHRAIELSDIVSNIIGTGLGYVAYLIIYKLDLKWFF